MLFSSMFNLSPAHLLLLLNSTTLTLALFWSKNLIDHPPDFQVDGSSIGKFLSKDEINSIFLSKDSLEKYARRPDCFHRASALIRTHCSQLEMDDAERVDAAISMTLCELATATHYSTPLECVPFTFGAVNQHSGSRSRSSQADCVDALSRSAQFWSSYSGYLREVPQLCFAFRRWNDIDTAREIYQNATLEKIAFLRFLVKREKSFESNFQSWEENVNHMRRLMLEFQSMATSLENQTLKFTTDINADLEKKLTIIETVMLNIHQAQENQHTSLLRLASTELEHVSQKHATSLEEQLSIMINSIKLNLELEIASIQRESRKLSDVTNGFESRWLLVENKVDGLSQYLTQVQTTASSLTLSLNHSVSRAEELRRQHGNALLSTAELTKTVDGLAMLARDEMQTVGNVSQMLVKRVVEELGDLERLKAEREKEKWWGCHWLASGLFRRLLEIFVQVDQSSLDYYFAFSSRILLPLSALISSLISAAFSGVITLCIVVFSSRKRFGLGWLMRIRTSTLNRQDDLEGYRYLGLPGNDSVQYSSPSFVTSEEDHPCSCGPCSICSKNVLQARRKFWDTGYRFRNRQNTQKRFSRIPVWLWRDVT